MLSQKNVLELWREQSSSCTLYVIYCMQYSNRRTFYCERRMEPWQAGMWSMLKLEKKKREEPIRKRKILKERSKDRQHDSNKATLSTTEKATGRKGLYYLKKNNFLGV